MTSAYYIFASSWALSCIDLCFSYFLSCFSGFSYSVKPYISLYSSTLSISVNISSNYNSNGIQSTCTVSGIGGGISPGFPSNLRFGVFGALIFYSTIFWAVCNTGNSCSKSIMMQPLKSSAFSVAFCSLFTNYIVLTMSSRFLLWWISSFSSVPTLSFPS